MTLGQIWILEKFGEQLSELPPKKTFSPGGKGGTSFRPERPHNKYRKDESCIVIIRE
jgi:hypothetical protein